jgi:hypothetical protein
MKKFTNATLAILWGGFLMAGCYPGGVENISDTDVVLTQFDADWDFSGDKTYYMPDTVSF